MDALLCLIAVTSHHYVKGLWRLCDAIEANARGLKALKVEAELYGSLMVSILMSKIPSEDYELQSESKKWDFNEVMQIVQQEIDAREHYFAPAQQTQQPLKPPSIWNCNSIEHWKCNN